MKLENKVKLHYSSRLPPVYPFADLQILLIKPNSAPLVEYAQEVDQWRRQLSWTFVQEYTCKSFLAR